jgi:hypothetical protein
MLECQFLYLLIDSLVRRARISGLGTDRGDVAEKVVIVGIFVAIAIAVGLLIKSAVVGDAHHIANTISTAPN